MFGIRVSVFTILQHTSTLLGLFVVANVLYKLPTDDNVQQSSNARYLTCVLAIAVTVLALRLLCDLELLKLGDVIVAAIAAVMIALTLAPILLRVIAER